MSSRQHRAARSSTAWSPLLTAPCVLAGIVALGCTTATPGVVASAEQRSSAEYDLAREAFGAQHLREALAHIQKALELDDQNADAAYLGALVMLQFCAMDLRSSDCRFPDAERYARQAVEAAPAHRDAKNALGVILVHQKRYDEAIDVLKPLANDILYATPENAWGNLGWAYLERGNLDEAIDALRRAVAAQPRFCVGNYRLGLAYEKKGEMSLAREALTKAVDTDMPECKRLQDAFGARARVLAKMGLDEEARADLLTCRDLASTTPAGKRCSAGLSTQSSN